MSEKEQFLKDLGQLLERYPQYGQTFTVDQPQFDLRGLDSTPEEQRCCEWGRIPGHGYVCLRWCD